MTGDAPQITQLKPDTAARYLDDDTGTLLIACLRKDRDYRENLSRLGEAASLLREDGIVIGYVLDDMLPYFTDRFGIAGTPTYLMIRSGVILGALLGKTTAPALARFVREMDREYRPPSRDGKTGKAGNGTGPGGQTGLTAI